MIITGGGDDELLNVDERDLVCEQPESGPSLSELGDVEVSATAADGTAAASVATNKPFGYMDQTSYLASEAAGGANATRIYVPGPVDCPSFNWATFDNAFQTAGQHDLRIVLGVTWRQTCGDPSPPTTQADLTEWTTFIRDAVNHAVWYSAVGGLQTYSNVWVEVWNEPNVRNFWGGAPSAFGYALIYWYAWSGVQAAEGDWGPGFSFPIMTAGMGRPDGSCPGDSNYVCVRRFLEDVKATLSAWSAVWMVEMTGAHIYPFPYALNQRTQQEYIDEVGRQFNQVRTPFPAVQTFITEAGIRSDAPLNQLAQCNRLLDIYRGWLPSTATGGLIVFRLVHNLNDPAVEFRRMGTVEADGTTPKKAFFYLQALRLGQNPTSCS